MITRFLFDSTTVSFFLFWNRRSLWHNANCWQTRLLKALRCWSSLWQQMRQHQRCWAGTRTCARWSKHFHWISMGTEHRHPFFPQQQAGDSLGKASWIQIYNWNAVGISHKHHGTKRHKQRNIFVDGLSGNGFRCDLRNRNLSDSGLKGIATILGDYSNLLLG